MTNSSDTARGGVDQPSSAPSSVFELWSRGKLLGESDIEAYDDGMNIRSGRFRPSEDYLAVRAVFKVYSAALDLHGEAQHAAVKDYFDTLDELGLTVRERGGAELESGAIRIYDFDESLDEIQLEVWPPSE